MMKTFEITAIKRVTTESEAESREDAVTRFHEAFPGYLVETVDDDYFIGLDESTGKPVFDDDDYHEDEDGIITLNTRLQ